MKVIKLLIIAILFNNTNVIAKNVNIDLYNIYKNITKDASNIIKNKPIKDISIINEFEKNFENSSNILSASLGTTDVGNCGLLYLKPSCFKYEYHHEQEFKDVFGCLYIYGLPMYKLDSDKYIIQEAILFKKTKNSWKILGNRFAGKPFVEFAYAYFKGDSAKEMFTNICKPRILNKLKNR